MLPFTQSQVTLFIINHHVIIYATFLPNPTFFYLSLSNQSESSSMQKIPWQKNIQKEINWWKTVYTYLHHVHILTNIQFGILHFSYCIKFLTTQYKFYLFTVSFTFWYFSAINGDRFSGVKITHLNSAKYNWQQFYSQRNKLFIM